VIGVMEIAVRALAMVAIIGVGLLLKRVGLVRSEDARPLTVLLLWVTLPAALFTAFDGRTLDAHLLGLTLLAAVANTLQHVLGYLLAPRGDRRAQAFALLNSGGYNVGIFATPYLAAMLGPAAMVSTTMFDLGGAFTSSGPAYGWASALAEPPRPGRVGRVLRTIAGSPVFVTYLALVAFALSGLRLPAPVLAFTSTVGAANPFVAMVMIGIALELRLPRAQLALAVRFLVVRYGFAVVAAAVTWFLLPLPVDLRRVACVLLFAPMATMQLAFTARAGLDTEVSGFLSSVTILVGIVVMPAILLAAG
jgi:predicted permease